MGRGYTLCMNWVKLWDNRIRGSILSSHLQVYNQKTAAVFAAAVLLAVGVRAKPFRGVAETR